MIKDFFVKLKKEMMHDSIKEAFDQLDKDMRAAMKKLEANGHDVLSGGIDGIRVLTKEHRILKLYLAEVDKFIEITKKK